MNDDRTFEQIKKNNYGFIVMDVWDKHGCIPASRCVDELAVVINHLLLALMQDKNAYTAVCSNDHADTSYNKMNGLSDYKANLKEDYKELDSEIAESDYETGLRSMFYDEKYLKDSQRFGFNRNIYLEMEIVEECSCKTEHDSQNPKGVNPGLIPMMRKAETDHLILADNTMDAVKFMLKNNVKNVFYVGVHTNMCFLSRKNGLLKMLKHGIQTYIVSDLTDSRISGYTYPYMEHLNATDWFIHKIKTANVYTDGNKSKCMNCRSVESTFFSVPGHEERFRFRQDRRAWRSRGKAARFTDNKRDYDRRGRYGFPVGINYRLHQDKLEEIEFAYQNSEQSVREGWKYTALGPKEFITGSIIYYARDNDTGETCIGGINFLTVDYKEIPAAPNSYLIGRNGGSEYETISFQQNDIFQQNAYAAYCIETGRSGDSQYVKTVEFHTTLYSLFQVNSETEGVPGVPFADCFLPIGGQDDLEGYFMFFEGNFYVYAQDGTFMGRHASLLLRGSGKEKFVELSARELSNTYYKDKTFEYAGESGTDKGLSIKWIKEEPLKIVNSAVEILTEQKEVYANGIPIEITSEGNKTVIKLYNNRLLPWEFTAMEAQFKALKDDISAYTVYGGSHKEETSDTCIVMSGGSVGCIYGGGKGNSVSGNTFVELKGTAHVKYLYGGCHGGQVKGSKILHLDGNLVIGSHKKSGIFIGGEKGVDCFTVGNIKDSDITLTVSSDLGDKVIIVPQMSAGMLPVFSMSKASSVQYHLKEDQKLFMEKADHSIPEERGTKLELEIIEETIDKVRFECILKKINPSVEGKLSGQIEIYYANASRKLLTVLRNENGNIDELMVKRILKKDLHLKYGRTVYAVYVPSENCGFSECVSDRVSNDMMYKEQEEFLRRMVIFPPL